MSVEPRPEHRWLQQLLGDWTYHGTAPGEPDQPAYQWQGKESVRGLGDLWVLCESTGDMPGGGTGHSVITLGFDPVKGRFTGTFVGSMMTHLWVYDGVLDGERRLPLESDGPDFTDPSKLSRYKDVVEILGPDERKLSSYVRQPSGEWTEIMSMHYRRA